MIFVVSSSLLILSLELKRIILLSKNLEARSRDDHSHYSSHKEDNGV